MLLRPIGILFGITALLLMLVSPIIHIILSKKCLNNKIKLPLWIIHIIAAILGFSLPVLSYDIFFTHYYRAYSSNYTICIKIDG